jgi:hypothetical protein
MRLPRSIRPFIRVISLLMSLCYGFLENNPTRDQAAAITVITTKLSYEEYGHEIDRSFEFRINLDSKGKAQVRGQPDSSW